MSPLFDQLFHTYAAASFEKQLRLNERVGECAWSVDLDTGLLSFDEQASFRIQVLGTESEQSGTWLWAWANPSVTEDGLLSSASQLREFGSQHQVPELTEAQFAVNGVNGHIIGLAAAGICRADAYYLGHYEGGAILMLLAAPELQTGYDESPMRLVQVFTQFISAFPCDHHKALLGYLQAKGYQTTDGPAEIRATSPGGDAIRAAFDAQGRLAEIRA